MADPKHMAFVRRIAAATDAGRLQWEETAEDETFQASLPEYSVQIWRVWDRDVEAHTFGLGIFNSFGAGVLELNDWEFAPEEREDAQKYLCRTWERARNVARGADQAIDAILRHLE